MLVEMGYARFLSRKVLGSRLLGWLIAVANESAIPPALEPVRRILAGLCDPTIKGVWQPLLDALRFGPIDALARCPICARFFLRERKDQKACSKRCANALRVRKYRQRYLESYKLQRDQRAESMKGEKLTCSTKEERKERGGIASGSAVASFTSRPEPKAKRSHVRPKPKGIASAKSHGTRSRGALSPPRLKRPRRNGSRRAKGKSLRTH